MALIRSGNVYFKCCSYFFRGRIVIFYTNSPALEDFGNNFEIVLYREICLRAFY